MATNVEAHITGTVFRIETEVGAQVREGDSLVIIESMKMELPVESPASGRVASIGVEEGQSVEEGDLLLVLE
jgi:acetyl-CoA carboxylase biotin carboxyl carrier protein